jgi:energy-coupling factor transporter ATP-binding protein EcfA2
MMEDDRADKYKDILILCGIEITCFSKHLLAIFNNNFDLKNQEKFLEDIGITDEFLDKEDAMADLLGPSLLISKISDYGGIAILPHADSRDGFLYSMCKEKHEQHPELDFRGKSLAKILKSSGLYGIQIADKRNKNKVLTKLKNKDFIRNDRSLPCLYFSDSHGCGCGSNDPKISGKQIGSTYSIAKLSHVSFDSLKRALADPLVRILDGEYSFDYPYIIGCALKSKIIADKKHEYAFFHFNPEMNCVIGARGTGKSTLLNVIKHIISLNDIVRTDDNPTHNMQWAYYSAIVFIKMNGQIYALSDEPKEVKDEYTNVTTIYSNYKLYIRDGKHGFIKPRENQIVDFARFITLGYQQREIYEYGINPSLTLRIIDDYIKWKQADDYSSLVGQIKHKKEEFKELLNSITSNQTDKTFMEQVIEYDYIDKISTYHNLISSLESKLHKLRNDMIYELNSLLKGKVRLCFR